MAKPRIWNESSTTVGAKFSSKREEEEKKKKAADRRAQIGSKHAGETYKNVNGKGTWQKKNEVVKTSTTYKPTSYKDDISRARTESEMELRGMLHNRNANDPSYAFSKESKTIQKNISSYKNTEKNLNGVTHYQKADEDLAEEKKLQTDSSLNRYRGVAEYQRRRNEQNNKAFDEWSKRAGSVSFADPTNSESRGKKINPLRKGDYGLDEDTLRYFDMLWDENPTLAEEGTKLVQNSQDIKSAFDKNAEGYQKAALKSNQNISGNFTKAAGDVQKKIDDIKSGKIKVDDPNKQIQALKEKKTGFEQQARDYQGLADYDRIVNENISEMNNDPNAEKAIAEGKKLDTFLMDKNNPDFWKVASGFSVSSDEDIVRTAALTMTEEELRPYYWTVRNKGQEAGIEYLKQIYENGRTDEDGNTFGGLGQRLANFVNEQIDDPVFSNVQAFAAGAQNSIFGLRDFGERIGAGFANVDAPVHVEGLMNKVYQDNVQTGRVNKVFGDIIYNIGNMMPAIAVSVATAGVASPAVAGAISASVTGASSFGNTYQQARREGFDSESATLYATINGISEAALQYALTGVGQMAGGFTTDALATVASEAVKDAVKNPVAKYVLSTIVKQSINSLGEFTEEYLQEVLDPVFRNWALGEANEFQPFSQEALYAGLLGALSAGVMNSVEVAGDVVRINVNGSMYNRTTVGQLMSDSLNLPPTITARQTAEYFQQNNKAKDGSIKLSNMDAGLLSMQQAQGEMMINQIDNALTDIGLSWNGLSDEARAALVDPKNADFFADMYGLDINSNMSPNDIANAIKDRIISNEIESGMYRMENAQENGVEFERNRTVFEKIQDKLGLTILFKNFDNPNEHGGLIGDKLIINSRFANKDEAITSILTHEITHASELSKHYESLKNAVLKIIKTRDEKFDIEKAIDQKIADYKADKRNLSREGALAEIVAEFSENAFFNDTKSLVDLISEDKSLGQRILSWFQERIKGAEPKTPEEKMLNKAIANFKRAIQESSETSGYTRLAYQDALNASAGQAMFYAAPQKLVDEIEQYINDNKDKDSSKIAKEIWEKHLARQNEDGKWMIEIPDKDAVIKESNNPAKLSDILEHAGLDTINKLLDESNNIWDVNIEINPDATRNSFDASRDTIILQHIPKTAADRLDVLHEVQHAIDTRFNLSVDGGSNRIIGLFNYVVELFENNPGKYSKLRETKSPEEILSMLGDDIVQQFSHDDINTLDDLLFEAYNNSEGEQLATQTELRSVMSEDSKRKNPPKFKPRSSDKTVQQSRFNFEDVLKQIGFNTAEIWNTLHKLRTLDFSAFGGEIDGRNNGRKTNERRNRENVPRNDDNRLGRGTQKTRGQASIKPSKSASAKIDEIKARRGWTTSTPSNSMLIEDALIQSGRYTAEQIAQLKKNNRGYLPFDTRSGWERKGFKVKEGSDSFVAPRPTDMKMETATQIEQYFEAETKINQLEARIEQINKRLNDIYSGKEKVGSSTKDIVKTTLRLRQQIQELRGQVIELNRSMPDIDLEQRHVRDYYDELKKQRRANNEYKERPVFYADLLVPNENGELDLRQAGIYSKKQVYFAGKSRGQASIKKSGEKTQKTFSHRDMIHTEKQSKKTSAKDMKESFARFSENFKRIFTDSMASFEAIDSQIAKLADPQIAALDQRLRGVRNGSIKVANRAEEIKNIKKRINDIKRAQVVTRYVYHTANSARGAIQAADFSIGADVTRQGAYQADITGREIWIDQKDINGNVVKDENGNVVRRKCRSLYDIWHDVQERTKEDPEYNEDFQDFLRIYDHMDRTKTGHPKLASDKNKPGTDPKKLKAMPQEEAQQLADDLLAKHPEFEQLAREVWDYNHNLLKYLLDSGNISNQLYDKLLETHPHYIPADRDFDSVYGKGKYDLLAVRKDQGNNLSLPFLPIDQAMAAQTRRYMIAAKRNQMMNVVADAYDAHGKAIGNFVMGMTPDTSGMKLLADHEMTIEEIENAFNPELDEYTNKKNTIVFYRNGQKYTMQVSDGIYEGYTGLSAGMGDFEKIFGAPTRAMGKFFRQFVTSYNPTFIATNFLKDFGDAIFYSQNTGLFLKNFGRAWKEITTNGQIWQLYKANGGFSSSFFEPESNIGKRRNPFQRYFLDKIEQMNVFVEQAPRLSEFMTTLEMEGFLDSKGRLKNENDVVAVNKNGEATTQKGRKLDIETLRKAMFAANDITVNFGRSGTLTKKLNRSLIPFLNASVQGFSKITRQFQQNGGKAWARLAAKCALLGVMPAVLNSLLYKDDDDFKHKKDWERDNNYLFKLPDGKWLAIPRGRFMSFFAGIGNRAVRAMNGDDVDWTSMGDIIETNIAPANPIENNILSPIIRFATNKTWYGSDIDSYDDMKKPAGERYDSSTSVIFKALGKALDVSPKRLQVLFEDYTGFIGDVVVPETNSKDDHFWDNMSQKFIKDPVYSNDYGTIFNALRDETSQLVDYEGETEVPSVQKLKLQYLNSQRQVVSDIYDQVEELQNSDNTDKEKDAMERVLMQSKNEIYALAVDNADKIEKTLEKYYKVDEDAPVSVQKRQAYYAYAQTMKDLFGTKEALKAFGLDDDEIKEVEGKGINLNDYYEFYKATHSGDKYFSADEDDKAQSYTKSEKKQILAKLDLDEKTKVKLYQEYIENDDISQRKSIQFAIGRGISFNDYVAADAKMKEIGEMENGEGVNKSLMKKEWIANNAKDEKQTVALYMAFVESADVERKNSIEYAVEHDVKASSFLKREIQRAGEEGDKSGETSSNYYYEDGMVYEDITEKYVSGSKLVKAVHNMLNSGYSDKEIEFFYQREYGSDDAFVWARQSGMDAKTYLQYRENTALVTADKDANGKSISGTKKKKIFDIINEMPISKREKLILFMRDYSLSKDQYREIFDYIDSLNLSRDEKLRLAEGLGFLVEDGKVYMKKAS